jgi:hypothetical protein
MALRREPQQAQFVRPVAVVEVAVAVGIGGVSGQLGARHVLPQESLKGPDARGVDGILGQHRHAVLALENTEALSIIGVVEG